MLPLSFKGFSKFEYNTVDYREYSPFVSPIVGNIAQDIFQSNTQTEWSPNGSNIKKRNYTCFAREDLPWRRFGDYLKTRFEKNDKVNVYQYASSTGEETYSLKMLLHNVFKEKADKFYPIIAKDIDEETIKLNKLHQKIGTIVSMDDCFRMSKLLGLDIDNIKDYFATKQLIGNSKGLLPFVINPEMAKDIQFESADILNDINSIDSKNPSIVFCRNVWPYIQENQYEDYAQKLYDKLAPGSIVVIGDYDYTISFPGFPDMLEKAGFEANENLMNVSGHNVVFEKNE